MDSPILNEIMSRDLITATPTASLSEVAKMMAERRVGSLIVRLPEASPAETGIVTESDLLNAWQAGMPGETPVARIARQPVLCAPRHINVLEAAKHMHNHGVRHLLVVDEQGAPVGMVSQTDVSRHLGLNYFRYLRHVSTVMDADPAQMPARGTLTKAADFMQARQVSCVVLVDAHKKPIGILTRSGLLRAVCQGGGQQRKIADAMSAQPAMVAATDSIAEVIEKMLALNAPHMPVVNEAGVLVGLFNGQTLVDHLSEMSRGFLSSGERLAMTGGMDFQSVFRQTTPLIGILDEKGKVLDINDNIVAHSGSPREEIVGKLMWETPLWQREGAEHGKLQEALRHAKEGCCMPFETLHRFADGSPRWMLVRISKMRQSAEAPVRYIAEGFDITGQRRAEERLKLAAGVFRDTQEAILSVDAEGIVIDANTAFFALPGAKADIIGRPVADLRLNGTAPGAFGEAFAQAREHGHWHGQIAQSDPAAEEVAEWSLSVSSVRGADGNILQYVFLLLDISGDDTEQKRKAYYDSLTDMPNRIAFANRLMQALASAKGRQEKVGLVCLEVFDLRPINEACGRVVGDQLLEAVGLRLCALLRRADLSTRLGGTEFALVLNHLEQPAELEAVLNRVQAAFDEPFAIGKHTLRLEVAIGATFYPADDAPANELLTHAELALYEAKRLGGERWELFEPQTGLPRSAQAKAEASLTPLPNGLKKRRRATASA